MSIRSLIASLALTVLYASGLWADGMIIIERPPQAPPGWREVPLAVNYHHVTVSVDNQTAVTSVDQEFRNPNNMQVEGLYIFPLPVGASVANFSMWIDGKEQQAELLEREKAAQIYEDIVRRTQDPALLEYMGTKAFKLRIFPIPANDVKRVRLTYQEVVPNDGGFCTYRYPLNTEKFSSEPLKSVTIKVDLKSQVPMKNIFSPTHDVDVAKRSDHVAAVSFEQNNVKPDKDFLLYYTLSTEEIGINVVTHRPGGEDGYFMVLASPQQEGGDGEEVQKDVVFVMDTSGSMAEHDKMEQAKKALTYCLGMLKGSDRFNVIAFSTEARGFREGLVDATAENVKAAQEFVGKQKPRGGTNISDSLRMALEMAPKGSERPYMVVYMTDGQPTIGETTDPQAILAAAKKQNPGHARIFSLGVGYDVNTVLLDKLAEEARGTREYVTPEENLEIKVSNFYAKLAHPVLNDVMLKIEGMETYDVYPKALGDLFKGSQVVVYGRYRGDGHRAVRMTGTVNGKAREYVYEAKFDSQATEHEQLPRLWATSKIGYLLDAIRLHGEKAELRQEVVALAKEHGILTPYTSYLVLEDQARQQQLRPGAEPAPADQAVRDALGAGSSGGAAAPGRKREMEKAREGFETVSGENAVAASRAAEELKEGRHDDDERLMTLDADRRLLKQVGAKVFYNLGGAWVDSRFKPGSAVVQVKAFSEEYFQLLRDKPDLKKYFALGLRVTVVLGDTTYEVVE